MGIESKRDYMKMSDENNNIFDEEQILEVVVEEVVVVEEMIEDGKFVEQLEVELDDLCDCLLCVVVEEQNI